MIVRVREEEVGRRQGSRQHSRPTEKSSDLSVHCCTRYCSLGSLLVPRLSGLVLVLVLALAPGGCWLVAGCNAVLRGSELEPEHAPALKEEACPFSDSEDG